MATLVVEYLAMIFLLNIVVRMDGALDEGIRSELLSKERVAARAHISAGRLRHIWRTPAQLGNWSVWHVSGPNELHDIVSALPLFPWMTVAVHALADHPLCAEHPSLGHAMAASP